MKKYVAKVLTPAGKSKLEFIDGFDDYPSWGRFRDEQRREYTLKFDDLEEIKDGDKEENEEN
jgi:hypothetical protein